jgi:hypothetical protein
VNAFDLGDTTRCPRGVRCECCGTEASSLRVTTAALGCVGVLCLTLCAGCAAAGVGVPTTPATAARLVEQHAAHLGLRMAQMVAALDLRQRR